MGRGADPETGKIKILRFTSVQDAGKAIHPSYVEGQMQGGSVQGIGWALNEEYYMNGEGTMTNSSLLDYRMPTALDLPMIETIIVEVPNPSHPVRCRRRGRGEHRTADAGDCERAAPGAGRRRAVEAAADESAGGDAGVVIEGELGLRG